MKQIKQKRLPKKSYSSEWQEKASTQVELERINRKLCEEQFFSIIHYYAQSQKYGVHARADPGLPKF